MNLDSKLHCETLLQSPFLQFPQNISTKKVASNKKNFASREEIENVVSRKEREFSNEKKILEES